MAKSDQSFRSRQKLYRPRRAATRRHPYPHRDGGSVVAHGLGMTINGQDPSERYLLDAHAERFHQRSGRERRSRRGARNHQGVSRRDELYTARIRRTPRQINAIIKSGERISRQPYEFHRNDSLDARNSRRRRSRSSREISLAAASAGRSNGKALLFFVLRRSEKTWGAPYDGRA